MLSESRLYEIIGENIRRTREELPGGKMTQGALADAVGLERSSISNIEKAIQKVSIITLYQIAGVLGVNFIDLLPSETVRAPTSGVGRPRLTASNASMLTDVQAQLERYPLAARAMADLLDKSL